MNNPLKGKLAGFSMGKAGGFSAGAKGFSMKVPELPPDPLKDVPMTGDPELDSSAEMGALLGAMTAEDEKHKAFREHERSVADKINAIANPWYYTRICFQSEEQARTFNEAVGVLGDDTVIDGLAVARRLGIELPEAIITLKADAKPDKKLNALVLDPYNLG